MRQEAAFIACRDCGAVQHMPSAPRPGGLQCYQCGRALERTSGRSLDAALACAFTTFLLLLPANLLPLMTVHIAGVARTTRLADGLLVAITEKRTKADIDRLAGALAAAVAKQPGRVEVGA